MRVGSSGNEEGKVEMIGEINIRKLEWNNVWEYNNEILFCILKVLLLKVVVLFFRKNKYLNSR